MARVSYNAFRVFYPRFLHFAPHSVQQALISSCTMSSTIDQDVQYYFSTDFASIRGKARAWNVAPNTFLRRVNRGLTRRDGHYTQQILSPTQENMLVSWILEQERLGHVPIHQRVREFAAQIRTWPARIPTTPPAMPQLAYFLQNKVLEPHLIAAALLSLKFSTIGYDPATTRYSNSFKT
jgi:hypothetical protein